MALFSRRNKILFALFLAALTTGMYMVTWGRLLTGGIPEEFREARLQSATISQQILDLSMSVNTELEKVNQLDKESRYQEAVELANGLISRSQEVKGKAYELSRQMEIMAKELPNLRSTETRQAAFESISDRLTLISHLINYSNHLQDLLESLKTRFNGEAANENPVQDLIGKINEEVVSINKFNIEAGESMSRFDELIRQGK